MCSDQQLCCALCTTLYGSLAWCVIAADSVYGRQQHVCWIVWQVPRFCICTEHAPGYIQQLYHAGQCLVGVSQCLNIQELWHQIEGMLYTIETFRSDARRKPALATLVDD